MKRLAAARSNLSGILRRAAGVTAVAVLCGCTSEERAAPPIPPATGPNIVFIMADDLGYADLSIYGRQDYETPLLDRLAQEGVMLTQAYAAAPICSPTRVALMSGQYPARLAVGRKMITPEQSDKIADLLQTFDLPIKVNHHLPVDDLLEAMKQDKKVRAGRIRFVLPTAIGGCTFVDDLSEKQICAAIESLQQ